MMKSKYPSFLVMLIGVVFIAWGLFTYCTYVNFVNNSKSTNAIISSISSDTKTTITYVRYTINGKNYESRLDYRPKNLFVGNQMIIYYNPNNPKQIEGSNKSILNVEVICGLALCGLSVITMIINKIKVKT